MTHIKTDVTSDKSQYTRQAALPRATLPAVLLFLPIERHDKQVRPTAELASPSCVSLKLGGRRDAEKSLSGQPNKVGVKAK